MKFIKEYKIFEAHNFNAEAIKKMFESEIDWDMINNIKDMSLEYLDCGLKLTLSINIRFSHATVPLYYMEFSHYKEDEHWFNSDAHLIQMTIDDHRKYRIKYSISLSTQGNKNVREGKELRDRVKEAYPDILLTTY